MSLLGLVNIVLMVLLLILLFYMQKKHVSFSKRVFAALGLGVVFGLILQLIYGSDSEIISETISWYNIAGIGYGKFLQMIVMPLVFISIVSAFTKMKSANNIGKISVLILEILVGTTAVSALVGIGTTVAFDLEAFQIEAGDAETARGEAIEERYAGIQDRTFPEQILELLPANPFLDFTGARSTSTI